MEVQRLCQDIAFSHHVKSYKQPVRVAELQWQRESSTVLRCFSMYLSYRQQTIQGKRPVLLYLFYSALVVILFASEIVHPRKYHKDVEFSGLISMQRCSQTQQYSVRVYQPKCTLGNRDTNKRELQEEALFQWESRVFHLKCDKPIMQHETQDILSPHSVYEHNINPPLHNMPTQ